MCGIIGGIGLKSWPEKELLASIGHRGPDHQASFVEDNLFLGHTRLSILDLSSLANQPMFSDDGKLVIIFNGEIYNHQELRKKYLSDYPFRSSSSDTETLLAGFQRLGNGFFEKLNGIFAFAIYDREQKKLVLARDQFGVKPLYYYTDSTCFLFGSELKSFTCLPIDKEIDKEALCNYLTFLWSPGEATPFKKVRKVNAGCYIEISTQSAFPVLLDEKRFYQIPFHGKVQEKSEADWIDTVEEHLLQAVKRQLLSDVPVGFFLSGGLDSSLMAAMARKLYPKESFECFSIATDNDLRHEGFDSDIHYARQVAEKLNLRLNVVDSKIDIVNDFDRMIWYLDEPQADAAPLHVYNICKLSRQMGIKVLMGGAAGDDVFSGYRRHQAIAFETAIGRIPALARHAMAAVGSSLPGVHPLLRRAKKVGRELNKSSQERMLNYFCWLPVTQVKQLFSKPVQEQLTSFDPMGFFRKALAQIPDEHNPLNQLLFLEMRSFLVDHNLNYTDKLAMASGVEARVPFLDIPLVNMACELPPGLKMKGKTTKYILKKVAERYLPQDVIYRPKTGFGAPVRKWVKEDLRTVLADRLSPERIQDRGLFDPDEVLKLIQSNQKGRVDASYNIWCLLAIESWMQQFVDGKQLFQK